MLNQFVEDHEEHEVLLQQDGETAQTSSCEKTSPGSQDLTRQTMANFPERFRQCVSN